MHLSGFGNHHQTEAEPGALPLEQNSPQRCPLDLYAEQLSGSAFTRPRHTNLRTWLYRRLPSVVHQPFEPYPPAPSFMASEAMAPNPYRWSPFPAPDDAQDFVEGLLPIASTSLINTWIYQCNTSMDRRYFCNQDGELLFIPYVGDITLFTELGSLTIGPGKIAVIPAGITFKVILHQASAFGYLAENRGLPFTLPALGAIGANGLANPRHFLYPQAAYEDVNEEVSLIHQFRQQRWIAKSSHSPLNVVAWQGNYAPYSYDLTLFNTINTVSFDHADPSIFTVLTSESAIPGICNMDFVIFPSRWMVADHTFRPPYFHKNIMSELMGLVTGQYDAKQEGFLPGGISIHNSMTAHGPDSDTYQQAIEATLKPQYYENTLAFMLETAEPWQVSDFAMKHPARQRDYNECWQELKSKK